MQIIDFRARPRTRYFLKDLIPEPIEAFRPYFSIYHMESRLNPESLESTVTEMGAAGVKQSVILADGLDGCRHVADACNQFPGTFFGLVSIDIRKGISRSVDDLNVAFADFGMLGLTLSPFINGVNPTDPRNYPLYSLAEKLGKVVQIHASVHFNTRLPVDIGDPKQIDQLAVDFPNLRLVLGHAGNGFGNMGLTVAQRHPNVFIDFTSLHPKYLAPEMIHSANTTLRNKAIFGTNYPCLPYSIAQEWKKAIRKENHSLFFYENAMKALGIHAPLPVASDSTTPTRFKSFEGENDIHAFRGSDEIGS